MKVQYQILKLDEEHLKKCIDIGGTRDRVCFIPAKLDNYESYIQDSLEEAVEALKRSGNDYTEYTIIPRIYMTDYDDQ